MSQRNIELRTIKTGGASIAHWDSTHGNDVIIDISPDGKATRKEYGYYDETISVPIENLGLELIKLANMICDD